MEIKKEKPAPPAPRTILRFVVIPTDAGFVIESGDGAVFNKALIGKILKSHYRTDGNYRFSICFYIYEGDDKTPMVEKAKKESLKLIKEQIDFCTALYKSNKK